MLISLQKTFFVLIVGTLSGYFFKILSNKYEFVEPASLKTLAVFFQKLGMIWLTSITYIGSLWIFKIDIIANIISLPLVGAISILAGGGFALLLAKYFNYNRLDTGSLFSCGFFANTVSLGGMVCFFYLGEEGYAFVPIFTFLMRLFYYGIGFPVSRMHSKDFNREERVAKKLIMILKDPFFYIGIGSVILGLVLNISPLERPKIYVTINEIIIPMTTFILLFSVGLNLKLGNVNNYIKECLYISLIKFIAVPLITLIPVLLFNYQSIDNGIPLKVSLIMSSMPVAFNSVITANIYNLNVDMVNSCWIFTNFAVILVLPLLLSFINLF